MTAANRIPSVLSALSAHIRVTPAPANIHESRAILHELKKHGPITSYRNLRYDLTRPAPSSALLIYANAASRTRLIASTPTSITLSIPRINFLDLSPALISPYDDPPDTPKEIKTFYVTAEPSYFNHENFVKRQPYHGPFWVDWGSAAAMDLKMAIPEEGMLDLEKSSEVPGRMAGKMVPQSLEEMCGIGKAMSNTPRKGEVEERKKTQLGKVKVGNEDADRSGPMWENWSNF